MATHTAQLRPQLNSEATGLFFIVCRKFFCTFKNDNCGILLIFGFTEI
jgi:hypothetical protein